jgi:hypothetical protein
MARTMPALNLDDHGGETAEERAGTQPESDPRLAARQRDTAHYVADMILELRNMAKAARLYQVMVPLEYAYYEAFTVANRVEVPEAEAERLRAIARQADSRSS